MLHTVIWSSARNIHTNDIISTNICCPFTCNKFVLDNIDGWVALYDNSGNPDDAIYWTSSANQPGNILTEGWYDDAPCLPSTSCNQSFTLLSAKQIYQTYPGAITYVGENNNMNKTYSRIPDGGAWQRDITPSINDSTVGNCNGGSANCNIPSVLNFSVTTVTPSCGQSDGSITLTVTGGSGTYTYIWSPNAGTGATISSISAGSYSVTVNDGACIKDTTIVLSGQNSPSITSIAPVINPTCGNSDGSFTVNVTGGTPAYQYSNNNGSTYQSSNTFNGLTAGTYFVVVEDANGCTATSSITLLDGSSTIVLNLGPDIAICEDETVILDAGASFASYIWSNSSTNQAINITSSGVYAVTVTDSNGCTGTDQVIVTVNSLPAANAGPDQTICYGSSAVLTATGGASYIWNTGSINQSITISPLSTTTYIVTVTTIYGCSASDSVIVNVAAEIVASINVTQSTVCAGDSTQLQAIGGTSYIWNIGETTQIITVAPPSTTIYSVTVSDNFGCSDIAQIQIDVTDSIIVVITPPVICAGESATLSVSSGSSYLWSTSETTQSITVSPPSTTTYSVTVTDAGCTGSTSVVVTVGAIPDADAGNDQTICYGSGATLTATGGSAYLWSTSATTNAITVSPAITTTYFVTVTESGCSAVDDVVVTVTPLPQANAGADQEICLGENVTLIASGGSAYLWSTGETSNTLTVSPAVTAIYYVTVSSSGCSAVDNVTVTVNPLPTANAGANQTICENETATLTATGGTSYYWSTQSVTGTITVSPAGTTVYYVTVTDNNTCTDVDTVIVIVNPAVNASITASLSAVCQNEPTTLSAYGGITYIWSTGPATQTITVTPTSTTTYYVTVSNGNCSDIANIQITVYPGITATSSPTSVCQGESAVLNVSSGASYIWNTGETTQSIIVAPLVTSTYFVTVVSPDSCTASTSVTVTVNPLPQADAGQDQSVCRGSVVTLTASGGNNYVWSNSQAGATILVSPQNSITYFVTVTTQYGCSATDDVNITIFSLPVVYVCDNMEICQGESVQLYASGGIGYSWSPSAGLSSTNIANPTAAPDVTTTYTVTVSNQNGCTATGMVTITVNSLVTVNLDIYVSPSESICYGTEVTFTASSLYPGTNPVYQWKLNDLNAGTNSPVFTTSSLSDSVRITCILTSSELCAVNNPVADFVDITVHPLPKIGFGADIIKGCEPLLIHFHEASGNTGYTYLWSFGDGAVSTTQNPAHTYLNNGIYDVYLTVTSEYGCNNSLGFNDIISVYPEPEASIYASPTSTSILDPVVHFDNLSSGDFVDYCIYGDGDTTIVTGGSDFEHKFTAPGTYDVLLITETRKGCRDSISLTVVINDENTLYAPTAFTPDNNDMNDIFSIKGIGIDADSFILLIYNRWGEKVFETKSFGLVNNESEGWDGKTKDGMRIVQNGTYSWLVIYKDLSGVVHQEAGSVTVIR
ncbi:MAG: gliding motility-associated C-terminal domain-containing protein [Bacteroidia bacterium]|nr:gliding motility-associated C-terminal domain-containing protein [Bacteroidia bacterium]